MRLQDLRRPDFRPSGRWQRIGYASAPRLQPARLHLPSRRRSTKRLRRARYLRLDMPGHIKHKGGDTFSEVYLSYHGTIPAREFRRDFAPDDKFLYTRDPDKTPRRFIRA